jgi:hypothetical protein
MSPILWFLSSISITSIIMNSKPRPMKGTSQRSLRELFPEGCLEPALQDREVEEEYEHGGNRE